MAGHEKDAYLALIAARDPQIRALLEQGVCICHECLQGGHGPAWP
jgi:hypothetical protein